MREDGLRIDVRRHGSTVTVTASGDLDMVSGGELRTVARQAADDARRVVLDLDGLELIDSSGLGTLLNLRGELQRDGVRFVVRAAEGPVRQALESTGLAEMLLTGDGA